MKLATDTITVFNRYLDQINDNDAWIGTVISGVSYFAQVKTAVTDKGLSSAETVSIRVPVDAECQGKQYVTPVAFASAEDKTDKFCFAPGDMIVHGAAQFDESTTLPKLKEKYGAEMVTIVGATDNRYTRRAPHIKVVCQ